MLVYASIERRFLAKCIDVIVFLLMFSVISVSFIASALITLPTHFDCWQISLLPFWKPAALTLVLSFLYHVASEASPLQGTLGKRVCKIIVCNSEGNRISVLQAIFRYIAKFISRIFFYFGFLMIVFTKNRRAFHDFISHTCVVEANPKLSFQEIYKRNASAKALNRKF